MNKNWEKIKIGLYYFAVTTVVIMIVAASYITIFWEADAAISVSLLWQILLVAFMTSLAHLFFGHEGEKELSGIKYVIRLGMSYIYVNIVVLGLGYLFSWFDLQRMPMVIGMLLTVPCAFGIIVGTTFWIDLKTADEINQKLRERNKGEGDI